MKKKIMIIDDDRDFLVEFKDFMKASGYAVTAIDDPASARETALKVKPNVILLDIKMPEKSGFEIAEELKALDIPIILLSSFCRNDYTPFKNMFGITDCISKPIDLAEALSKVEAALKKSKK